MPIPSTADLIQASLSDLTQALKVINIDNIVPPQNIQLHKSLIQLRELFHPTGTASTTLQPRVPSIPPSHTCQPVQRTIPIPQSTQQPMLSPTIPSPVLQPRVKPPNQPDLRLTSKAQLSIPVVKPSTTQQPRVTLHNTTKSPPSLKTVVTSRFKRKSRRNSKYYGQEFVNHVVNAVTNQTDGKVEEYRDLIKGPDREVWYDSMSRELARLSHGRK